TRRMVPARNIAAMRAITTSTATPERRAVSWNGSRTKPSILSSEIARMRALIGSLCSVGSIMFANSRDGQRPVKHCQADDFRARDVRTVTNAFRNEKQRARRVCDARFLPVAAKNVSPFVRLWMRVRRDRVSSFKLAEHHHSTRAIMLLQNHQLNPFIRPRLPDFVFSQCNVRKHAFTEADCAGFASNR